MKHFIQKSLTMIIVSTAVLMSACSVEGPTGPAGASGPAGPGWHYVKSYSGSIPADGEFTINIPEIRNKRYKTMINAYWAFSEVPDVWFPLEDGWLDSTEDGKIFAISWSLSTVTLIGMAKGDLYSIDIYEID